MQILFKVSFFLVIFFLVFMPTVRAEENIVINEFFSQGSSDWVELYNKSSDQIDLSQYRLRDSSATNKITLTGQLAAHGFVTFDWGDKLNNSGDTIKLVLASDENVVIDQVTYGKAGDTITAPGSNQSAGRQTDGGSQWVIFATASKGLSNDNAAIVPTFTPTPTNAPTPTRIPTPTKTPIPTKSEPTATKMPTLVPTKASSFAVISDAVTSLSAQPTSILGVSTSAAPKPYRKSSQKKVLVKDATTHFPSLAAIIGGGLICACGILVFLKTRQKNYE